MQKLNAERLARAISAEFVATRKSAVFAATQGDWTSYMFELLARVATNHELWWAGCAPSLPRRSAAGEYREYLWDFTMYEPTEKAIWNLPKVVIEHENVHSLDAFRFDHWKTLMAAAPLRVAIGYTPDEPLRDKWINEINATATAKDDLHGWRDRPDVEDLIALGYWGMTHDGNFRFWRRMPGEDTWDELNMV